MIKSLLKGSEQTKPYPKLMRSVTDGQIVLMTAKNTGVVVYPLFGCNPIGFCSNSWTEGVFDEYNGPVTLQNA